MKINILRMAAKKGLLYLLIIGLCLRGLKIEASGEGEAAVGVMCLVSACVAWAIYEKISKNNLKVQNDKLEQVIDKYELKINAYESDDDIKQQLIKASDLGVKWETFLEKINNISKDTRKTEEELVEDIIDFAYCNVKKYEIDLDEYNKRLNTGVVDLSSKLNELSILEKNCKSEMTVNVTQVISFISGILSNLKKYKALFEANINYFNFLFFLEQNFEQKYAHEIKCSSAEAANRAQLIDEIVKSKSNQNLFPYLFYSRYLVNELEVLSKQLNVFSNFKGYPFQIKKIERIKHIYHVLESILNYISSSNILAKEKANKAEYERKEQYAQIEIAEKKERLRLEIKERETEMAQKMAITEAQLLDQKNKEKHLANEKAKLEKEKKEFELKSQENTLQLARIQESYGIKKALDANDDKWRADYNNLSSQQKKELQNRDTELKNLKNKLIDYDNFDAKHREEIKKRDNEVKDLKSKISSLESEIRKLNKNLADLEREARKVDRMDNDNLEIKYKKELQNRDAELKSLKKQLADYDCLNKKNQDEIKKQNIEFKNLKNKLSDYDKSDSKYENDMKKRDDELKSLKSKLSTLESDIRSVNSNKQYFERKTRNLEKKISNISMALGSLTNKVNNPPFNPEIVDLLPGYIDSLRQEVRQLKTTLS